MDIVLILKTTQWLAIAMFLFLTVYAMLQKPSVMQKHVILLAISCILMLFGSMIKWDASSLETAMVGASVAYIGKPYLMLAAYMLVSSFYGHTVKTRTYIILCIYLAIVPVLVYTNDYHHLYYATVVFDETNIFSPLSHTNGPFYYLTILNSIVFFVRSMVVIYNGYKKSKSPLRRRLSVYSILMLFFAMFGFVIYLLKLTSGYDSTMLGICIGSVFLCVLFFRCRIFDIVDQSKEYALDVSPVGLVVFDDANSIIYENKAADKFVGEIIPKEYIDQLVDGEKTCNFGDGIYSVNVKSISHRNDYIGKSAEIQDITESHNYKLSLEQAIQDTTDRLSVIHRRIFGSIASIVEARSLETGDHIKRVSEYAELIANTLRDEGHYTDTLTDDYISTLVLSSPLHDVGKVSIRDSILLKPGKLTEEEFEEMKKHSASGAQIVRTTMMGLESEEYIEMAADIALYHHERWDGKGYPLGLKGEEIPLSARIVAIADCYDAITSKRCYKDAVSKEVALGIIEEESGTHFDPVVVDAFFAGIKKGN